MDKQDITTKPEEQWDDHYHICPYCFHKHDESMELFYESSEDERIEVECRRCEKKFDVTYFTSYSFTTYPKEQTK